MTPGFAGQAQGREEVVGAVIVRERRRRIGEWAEWLMMGGGKTRLNLMGGS